MLTTHPLITDHSLELVVLENICGIDGLTYEEALQMLFPDTWWWYIEREVME